MRLFWKVTGIALLALGLAGNPSEAAMRLKAGHILPPTSDQGQAAEFFAKRVKELTKGEIEIQVFHAGELGKSIPSQLENLVSGAQDLFIDTFDYFKAWDPRFGVVNTPFVFRDREHFKKFLASDLFNDMVASLEKRGVVFLGKGNYNWLRAGDRGLLTRTPILKPEDLKGYKLRMFQAEAPIKAWAAFGANIQVIPWPDTYTALATGTVDGLTTVLSASYLTKQTEAVRFFTNVARVLPDRRAGHEQAHLRQAYARAAGDLRDRREGSGPEVSGSVRGGGCRVRSQGAERPRRHHHHSADEAVARCRQDRVRQVRGRKYPAERTRRPGSGDQVAAGQASNRAPMKTYRKVLAAIGVVELWVAIVAFVFVVLLAITQVLYRYLLAGSIWWAQEIAQLAMLVAYFFGIAYVYKAKQDIIVGFLVSRLSRRMQVMLAILTQVSIAVFCLFLVVTGLELAPAQLVFYTYILNIPRFYSMLPLIIASASMALTAVYYAIATWQSRHLSAEEAAKAEREALIADAPEVAI